MTRAAPGPRRHRRGGRGPGDPPGFRLIRQAHSKPGWYLHTPTCALVEADRARPGTAEHLAALPGVTVLDIDLAAALTVAADTTWAQAHTRYAAAPTPDRPAGAVVATTEPKRWVGEPVRVIDLTP